MLWNKVLQGLDVDAVLSSFSKTKVLVIGDLILDEFIWGKVERISPEAPVPVVEVEGRSRLMGGAANVAHNIRSLGGEVYLCGVLGEDEEGAQLKQMLKEKGIKDLGVFVDPARPTTVKTRVIASGQQVVRFDREVRDPILPQLEERLITKVKEIWPEVHVVLLSDYGKGVITKRLMKEVLRLKGLYHKKVVVDPKVGNFHLYRGVTIMTPNTREAEAAASMRIRDLSTLTRAGVKILKTYRLEALLITRGEEGMALFRPGEDVLLIPTVAKEVYDVTGAGDTVAATLSLGLGSGLDYPEAAALANCAAGIVVGKRGTATVNPSELKGSVMANQISGH